jgi:hypothetical protein
LVVPNNLFLVASLFLFMLAGRGDVAAMKRVSFGRMINWASRVGAKTFFFEMVPRGFSDYKVDRYT